MNETKNNKEKEPLLLKGKTNITVYEGYTCIGGRDEDQDCLACDILKNRQVFVVCDGMGGQAGGCVASETAARTLIASLRRQAEPISLSEAMKTAVSEANTAVYQKAQQEPSLRGMGTTLTLLVIDNHAAYVTHIGDSRIYQLRKGSKVFRTFDNSMVFEQVAKGSMTEEEARVHPRSNILSKAIGVMPEVETTVTKLEYRAGDRFVLCCDGVWNCQPEADIIAMFTAHDDVATTVHATRSLVEKIGQESGGRHDNHTMIVVDVKFDSTYRRSLFSKIISLFK